MGSFRSPFPLSGVGVGEDGVASWDSTKVWTGEKGVQRWNRARLEVGKASGTGRCSQFERCQACLTP